MFRIDKSSIAEQSTPFYTLRPKPIEELYLGTAPESEEHEEPGLKPEARIKLEPEPNAVVPEKKQDPRDTEEYKDIIKKAEAHAEQIIKDAESRVEQIFSNANVYADGLKVIAQEEGFAKGMLEAEAQVHIQMEHEASEFKALLDEISSKRDNIIKDIEDDVIDLVLDIAKKVVHNELENSEDSYRSYIRNAVIRMKNTETITVRLSVDEFEKYIASGLIDLSKEFKDRSIKVISDVSLEKGSCIVESNGELVDAGVDTQFGRIETEFKGENQQI